MSYILDALRRADAERERGSVPGIHAQPAMLGEADSEAPRTARPGLWIGMGFVLLLAVLGWWLLRSDAPPPATAPALAAPAPASPPAAVAPVAAPPVLAAVPVAPAPPPALLRASEPSRPVSAKVAVAKPVNPPASAVSKPVARAAASVASAASVSAAPEPRVYQLSELPDDIRRELPTLSVGGAMYSQNPANRMLIVNGQTFHEGDKLAPNLSLEQIKLKSAVLEYKGYRYGITY